MFACNLQMSEKSVAHTMADVLSRVIDVFRARWGD